MQKLTDLTKEELIELIVREREVLSGWQPIESAPRDGTHILLLVEGCVIEGFYESLFDRFEPITLRWHGCGNGCGGDLEPPTHWQTLPTPPMGV